MRFVSRTTRGAAPWLPIVVALSLAALWRGGLVAQEGPAIPIEKAPAASDAKAVTKKAADDKSPEEQTAVESIGAILMKSGITGIVFYGILFFFSLVSLTVGLERVFNLRRGNVIPRRFVRGLRDLLNDPPVTADELRHLCDSTDSPVSRILKVGVLRAGRPLAEVERAMEDAAAREMADLRGRNRLLYVLGNVGPLIGLLGTVVGMIFTFGTASKMGLGSGERLAEGIYLALMCTAGGLAIAIPSLLVAAMLNTRAERLMREVVECLSETSPTFGRLEKHRVPAEEDMYGKTLVDYSVQSREAS